MGAMIDKTKGRIKQAYGALTGDKALKREGEADEGQGKVKAVTKDVKKVIASAKHAVKEAVK